MIALDCKGQGTLLGLARQRGVGQGPPAHQAPCHEQTLEPCALAGGRMQSGGCAQTAPLGLEHEGEAKCLARALHTPPAADLTELGQGDAILCKVLLLKELVLQHAQHAQQVWKWLSCELCNHSHENKFVMTHPAHCVDAYG